MGRVLTAAGLLPAFPAERVDHANVVPSTVPPGVTVEYGRYLSASCIGCHRPDFSGGALPAAAPSDPPATNLTPAGRLGKYAEADFVAFFRSGQAPDGHSVDSRFMPWQTFSVMTDDELKALFMYLKTVPARVGG